MCFKICIARELQYKPSLSFVQLVAIFSFNNNSLLALNEVPFSFVMMKSEKIAFIDCVLLLLLLNFSFCDKYKPKPDDVAPSVQVSHFDCSEMTENNFYSLNQFKPCSMAPQKIEMINVKLTMYTKHFQ